MKHEIYEIAVVGAGPAGMTAALYAARAERSVLLLEGTMYGGQIVQSASVENYPGVPNVDGYTLAELMMTPLRTLDVDYQTAAVQNIEKQGALFLLQAGAAVYRARAVIVATGVQHRRLQVPGEESFIGRGVSFCATCDGRFYRGKEVSVIGGGNTAVQDALVLSEFCSRVYLIHRRDEFRAEDGLVARLHQVPNIEPITKTVVKEIQGGDRPSALLLQNVESGERRTLPVSGIFEAVGMIPQNAVFADLAPLDADGYFLTDENCATATAGLYAAGDCRRKRVRQLTTATADGTVAALAAAEWLSKQ